MKTDTTVEISMQRAHVAVFADEGAPPDRQTAESVRKALTRNTEVAEDKIQVRLDDGWVYIRIQA